MVDATDVTIEVLRTRFVCVSPLGSRSSRNFDVTPANTLVTNRWDYSSPELRDEMDAFQKAEESFNLAPAAAADLWARTIQLVNRAKQGVIRFGGEHPEGRPIYRTGFIVELRPRVDDKSVLGDPPRTVRLYFAEPEHLDDVLVALCVASKEASADGSDEQNASIDVAESRGRRWYYDATRG